MRSFFNGIKPGYYGVVALDSWYRMIPAGVDENSNSEMTELYNLLDQYAAMLLTSFLLVHHMSKGLQGDKQITDVGAGAGAMSRAADCHLILRPHKEDDCAVLQSAVRSFPPMPAVGSDGIIYALLNDIKDELIPLEMARRLGYTPMTMRRANVLQRRQARRRPGSWSGMGNPPRVLVPIRTVEAFPSRVEGTGFQCFHAEARPSHNAGCTRSDGRVVSSGSPWRDLPSHR
jgi:hypothetical protein